ncbi:MAG TPA: hypothetical protein IGS53_02920 [Leptolyngbyaceae cyanobacterium M33_DOE_097]|nr:hypothetical protein [Leptolyngbyaceae cyanobacterium M33_DOE_097]
MPNLTTEGFSTGILFVCKSLIYTLTGDNMARELAGRGIGHETHAENKAVYEV